MDLIELVTVVACLVACKPSARELRQLLTSDDAGCLCPCACAAPDAAVPDALVDAELDAAPDAAPPIDLATAWTRTTITAGASTGLYRGADGVALDGEGCWVTAWEEGGAVTRACPNGAGGWMTELVATGLSGPEDAKPGDIDGDGWIDVVTACDAGQKVNVSFRGASNITIDLTASHGHGHVMQVAIGDVNGDGQPDIIMGSRIGAAAALAWLENPGPANARLSVWWTYHEISAAGWIMSIVPRDVNGDGRLDVIVSDRAKLSDGTWGLYGARWMEQLSDGTWMTHAISAPAGSCSPYASTSCTKTPGDEMFARVVGNDVYDCTSAATQADSRIVVHHTADWLSWTHTALPPAANVGHCQGVLVYDVDQDGDLDIVTTTWKGNAYPVTGPAAAESGVYWLRNNGDGSYSRGEVSGPEGGKFDNVELAGRCVITSEQLDPAGGLGVVLYCPPGVSP